MKLNDFIKQEPTPKKSGYKVVVGNTPKEQQLEKEASKVVVLETKNSQLNIEVDKLEQENKFLKEQLKINQHEKNEFKGKADKAEDLKVELLQKENRLTDVLEESHELAMKEQRDKELIDELRLNLNTTQGEAATFKKQQEATLHTLNSESAKLNGLSADYNRQKEFSEKLENDYNKVRERNIGLVNERDELSRLKAEFQAKSVRLGEELNKATNVIKDLESKLEHTTKLNSSGDKQLAKSSNLNVKLSKDLDKATKVSNNLESSLNQARKDVDNMSQITQIYKEELSRQKREAAEWNVAKQQLRLGSATTYPNKLGFGASPFFKLNEEK